MQTEVKVKVTGVKKIDKHRIFLSKDMCVLNIKSVAQLVWELRTIFKTYMQILKPKCRNWGQGHSGKR